jgi:hypothetical protein
MIRTGRALSVAWLVATVGCLVAGPASASTITSTSVFVSLPNDVNVTPNDTTDTVLLSTTLPLVAGESRRVVDRLGARLSSSEGAEVDNRIVCLDPGGTHVAETSSGTNHRGSSIGEIGLRESLLLIAPATGTYTCQILGRTSDGTRTNFVMTAVKGGPPFTTTGTWLRISAANEVGSHAWSNEECNSPGTFPTCVYLGGSGAPHAAHVFSGPNPELWTASPDTTQVDVVGTFQITSCYHGTASCVSSHWGDDGWFGTGIDQDHNAQLQSFIELNQLNPDGSVCRINQSSDDGTPSPDDSTSQGVYYIRDSVHHLPINYHLTTNVSPDCYGSRRFVLDLYVAWMGGNPIKLDNGGFNIIRSVYGATTTSVPNVVGASEAQAVNLLRAGQLQPVTVGRVMNPAPVGTVFLENAPGGAVEPTGSEVNLSVSLGQVTVPDVRSLNGAAASRAITAAGLVVGQMSTVNNCVDPGLVQLQNPTGGAQVVPGTAVSITVSTCTSPGGGPPHQRK